MLQNAIKLGVKIALGTDQFPFEPNDGTIATVAEAELYVKAGMTPLQALLLEQAVLPLNGAYEMRP